MRHRVAHRKLGRVSEHRLALLRNQATALIRHERITTTLAKAKELRPFVERLITLAKRGIADGAGDEPRAARAPDRGARHGGSQDGRQAVRVDRAALRRAPGRVHGACCGPAAARATTRRWPRSSSSAASTRPTRRPGPPRTPEDRPRKGRPAWAAACAGWPGPPPGRGRGEILTPRASGCGGPFAPRRSRRRRAVRRLHSSRWLRPRRGRPWLPRSPARAGGPGPPRSVRTPCGRTRGRRWPRSVAARR